ncbi:hypothetical protein [Blastococcus atacamensis]|uniref:hypothetical protein n=1 Tax=Blastococcus atacamensis TaxID=2070508 RepID=UPI000CEC3F50|nr:hypothetical protein [Blastococcus atacamensis]
MTRRRPEVVAFDVNETLLDPSPVRAALVEAGQPGSLLGTVFAAHGWDVLGAQRAGLTGAWFPRSDRAYPAVYEPAHVRAQDLAGAVDALLALPA